VSRFPEGTETTGKVVRTESFGAFVELVPGLEGLVHISEIGAGRRLNHAKEAVQPGQEVQVRVLGVDTARRRISLSMSAVGGGDRDDSRERDRGGDRDRNRGDRDRRDRDRDREPREEYETAGRTVASSGGSGFGSMADFFSRSKRR
jgi:predicted RNA-binding protein with RPS1 domain